MSLVLQAAPASHVFPADLAREVSETLERRFGFISDNQYTKLETFISKLSPPALVRKPNDQIFHSDELPDTAWEGLQRKAAELVGAGETQHLQFVTAGRGVYITGVLEPQLVRINQSVELQVAALSSLIRELLAYSSVARLPVEEEALRAKYDAHRESDGDLATLTYLQLMLAAQFASRAGCALWVVK